MSKQRKSSSQSEPRNRSRSQSLVSWRSEVLSLDLQKIENRSCEVIFLVESDVACSELVDNVHFSGDDDLNPVKFVRYSELIYNVTEYWGKQSALANNLLYKKASLEVSTALNQNETISCELLSYLLKMELMKIIQDDILAEQKDIYMKRAQAEEERQLYKEDDDSGELKGAKGKGQKNKKEVKKKEKSKEKGGGKNKKGKNNAKEEVDPDKCELPDIVPRPTSIYKVPSNLSQITVEDKELYIVLTGFYDAQLIRELKNIGVPVSCIMEVTESKSILKTINESKPTPTTTTQSMVRVQSSDSMVDYYVHSSTGSKINIINKDASVDQNDSREIIINEFWKEVLDLLHGPTQHEYLKNVFHMKYCTEDLPKDNREESAIKRFDNICEHITKLSSLKRQYVTYIRNLKLQDLGASPKFIPARCLRRYSGLMNRYPPDCFSVALLLYCLIEEVCVRTPANKDVISDSNCSVTVDDSLILESESMEAAEEAELHGSLRDQVTNLLHRYKKRQRLMEDADKKLVRCHKCNYQPRIDLKPNQKPFTINEKNRLEMLANSYKKNSEELVNINLRILQQSRPALLRKHSFVNSNIEKLINEFNIESCKTKLLLSKEQLCDAIHLYFFDKIHSVKEPILYESEFSQNFPTKTRSLLLNETQPKISEFMSTDSADSVLNTTCEPIERKRRISSLIEDPNISKYHRYKEVIPASALLQELAKVDFEYSYIDHKYCSITDALLLRFHNKLDRFGFTTNVFRKALRTPVCLKDFCQYVAHEDARWLEAQEYEYLLELENQYIEAKRKKQEYLRSFIPDEVVIDDSVFIIQNSLKWQEMQQQKAEDDGVTSQKKTKKSKSKDTNNEKSKKSSEKSKKNAPKGKVAGAPKRELPTVAEIMAPVPKPKEPKLLSPRCAVEGEPYSFLGYDFQDTRVQVSGSSSIFQSFDGVSLNIDKTVWLGQIPHIVTKVKCNGNWLVLHSKQEENPFMFHFALDDDIIIAFGKPFEFYSVDVALCKKICQSKVNKIQKEQNMAYKKKPQKLYFVSEKQNCVVKCLRVPFSTEKSLILSENTLVPFLQSLERFNIKARVSVPSETLRERQERRHNLANRLKREDFNKPDDPKSKCKKSSYRKERVLPKLVVDKKSSTVLKDGARDHIIPPPKEMPKLRSVNTLPEKIAIESRKEILEKLKTAWEKHVPVFKICSSKLHKFQYVKRAKSYVTVPVGNIVKRILYTPTFYKSNRNIQVTKCLPIGCTDSDIRKYTMYDLRVSLVSGLVVKDMPGIDSEYACIKQYYVDKGPQCKNIQHEEYRLFLRNGNVVIKRCDGNVDIFSSNGSIFHLDVPYLLKTDQEKAIYRDENLTKLKKAKVFRASVTPIHACSKNLTLFQRYLQRTIHRRYKHLIDSNESRYQTSRRAYLRAQKRHCKDPKQFYLLQTFKGPFPGYSLITPEGTEIKVTNKKVVQEHKYYVTTDRDFRSEETLTEREDGTCCLLNSDGVLVTQFADGTRLKTWFVIDVELVYTDKLFQDSTIFRHDRSVQTVIKSSDGLRNPRLEVSSIFIPDMTEGWVLVHIYYEYKHPNYATVLFGGEMNEMKISLPNESIISSDGNGPYSVLLDKNVGAEISSTKIVFKGSSCFQCEQKCNVTLNIDPLYYNKPVNKSDEFVRVKDSYGKMFVSDYDGNCMRNAVAGDITVGDNGCSRHVKPDFEKLYVVKKDFSGYLLWNTDSFMRHHEAAGQNLDTIIQSHGYHAEEPSAIEFKKFVYKPFHKRYCLNYEEPHLILAKYRTTRSEFQKTPSYTVQRVVYPLPDLKTVEPIYEKLIRNDEKSVDLEESDKFEAFLEHVSENMVFKKKSIEQADTYAPDVAEKAFEPVISQCERWYKWQEECKKYKEFIHHQYVPLYFKSKFGERFADENREHDAIEEQEEEEDNEEKVDQITCPANSDEEVAIKNAKTIQKQKTMETKLPREQKDSKNKQDEIIIKKEKINESRKTASAVITTTRETIQLTAPRNLVVVYNHEANVEKVEVGEANFVATSAIVGKDESISITGHNKMLVLTDVSNESKAKIAETFIEFEDKGSRALIGKTHISTPSLPKSPRGLKAPRNSEYSRRFSHSETLQAVAKSLSKSVTDTNHNDANKLKGHIKPNYSSCPSIPHEMIVHPVLCRIERFQKHDNQNGSIESIVSKTVDILFDLGPSLKQVDQDNLIRGMLTEAQVKTKDAEMLGKVFEKEILSRDFSKHSESRMMLQTIIKMIKQHFKKAEPDKIKTVVNLKSPADDARYRVTMIVGNVITAITDTLKSKSGKLTTNEKLAVIDSVLNEVSSANLDCKERKLFLESLDNAAEEALSSVASKRSNTDESKQSLEDKQCMLNSVLKTIERYKKALVDPFTGDDVSKPEVGTKPWSSDFYSKLKDKSQPVPLGTASALLLHYSDLKGKRKDHAKLRHSIRTSCYKIPQDRGESNVRFIKHAKTDEETSYCSSNKNLTELYPEDSDHYFGNTPKSIGLGSGKITSTTPSREELLESMMSDSVHSGQCEFCKYAADTESAITLDLKDSEAPISLSLVGFCSKAQMSQQFSHMQTALSRETCASDLGSKSSSLVENRETGSCWKDESELPAIKRLPLRSRAEEMFKVQFEEINRIGKSNQKSEDAFKVGVVALASLRLQ